MDARRADRCEADLLVAGSESAKVEQRYARADVFVTRLSCPERRLREHWSEPCLLHSEFVDFLQDFSLTLRICLGIQLLEQFASLGSVDLNGFCEPPDR